MHLQSKLFILYIFHFYWKKNPPDPQARVKVSIWAKIISVTHGICSINQSVKQMQYTPCKEILLNTHFILSHSLVIPNTSSGNFSFTNFYYKKYQA